ncbi:inovirus Gp2 family protein [Shewanella algae]|uniref:inovirus Gp2 family protein n=1 Tax=Shewanella algae TaxID=38313 RepID=UPI0035307201
MITRFLESLKAQIKHDCLQRSQASMGPVHSSDVAYIWVKESSNTGHSHYHICLFFNGYAYRCLGLFQLGRNNLYNRIHKAWASATNTPIELMQGSIHIPENAQYQLLRSSPEFQSVFNDLFRRLSYFSKIDTKEYGDRSRHFGCSRV